MRAWGKAFSTLYDTLTAQDKKRVDAFAYGIVLAKRPSETLSEREKRYVAFYKQGMRLINKKRPPELALVSGQSR